MGPVGAGYALEAVNNALLASARERAGGDPDYLEPIRLAERRAGVEIRG